MAGRPSKYTDELAEEICLLLVEGKSLPEICTATDMPGPATVYRWLAQNDAFRERYRLAREFQADTMADMVVAIPMMAKPGDNVALIRAQMDAMKWRAGKLRPVKYGEAALMRDRVERDAEREMLNVTLEENNNVPTDPKQIARVINYMNMTALAKLKQQREEENGER